MNKFDNFLKNELNENQLEAVKQKSGSSLVIAGAGSGKTRVITARITNLILNHNVNPHSILALTFTNKAAKEMKIRINKFLDESNIIPFVGTFHSYCLLLLRKYSHIFSLDSFSIMDTDDQSSLIKKILKKYSLEKQFSARQVQYEISMSKNKINKDENLMQPAIQEVFAEYEKAKKSANCLDFDDLIIRILELLKTNPGFKTNFQSKVRHILVDEYQDTNEVQHELLKEMALNDKKEFAIDSLCAVGDEDQSIYSWRGAVVKNMINFQKDFAPVEKIKIEQNYRSVEPILQAANSVIGNNKTRYPKNLWSEKKALNRILAINCKSDYQESDNIATFLSIQPKQKKLNDIAIIYRTHYQSRLIEESLIHSSIPYKIIGGLRFYERKEIKDILAHLKLIINPFDKPSLSRVINCPARGLGLKFEELLFEEWNLNPLLNFKQILNFVMTKISATKAKSVQEFLHVFESIEDKKSINLIIKKIITETNYVSYLKKAYDSREAESKTENINELLRSVDLFEEKINSKEQINDGIFDIESLNVEIQNEEILNVEELNTPQKTIKKTLESFLYEIALLQEKVNKQEENEAQVQLMTLHAAKGLEFDTVIIPGVEETVLPNSRSLNSLDDLEEERRLFYVGITRAKERLLLLHSNYRNSFGSVTDRTPSRFLSEIPSKLMQHIDTAELHQFQIKQVLNEWLGHPVIKSSLMTFGSTVKTTNFKSKETFNTARTKKTNSFGKTFSSAAWNKNQMINHKKFGPGLIKKVEKRKDNYYLTIAFKTGEKKILSSFVTKI